MTVHKDTELFATIKAKLYTPVIGDILDLMGRNHQFLPPRIRPLLPTMQIVGRAMPSLVSDVYGPQKKQFGYLTEALDQLEPGEVYISPPIVQEVATWGEILTVTSQNRGAVGAVVDGYHRDTNQVLARNFPVFSWGPYAQDSSIRTAVRDYRVPVEIGKVLVTPGDLIIGDIDGVLVVPQELEAEVIERALEKAATENVVCKAIDAGLSATDAFAQYGVL